MPLSSFHFVNEVVCVDPMRFEMSIVCHMHCSQCIILNLGYTGEASSFKTSQSAVINLILVGAPLIHVCDAYIIYPFPYSRLLNSRHTRRPINVGSVA